MYNLSNKLWRNRRGNVTVFKPQVLANFVQLIRLCQQLKQRFQCQKSGLFQVNYTRERTSERPLAPYMCPKILASPLNPANGIRPTRPKESGLPEGIIGGQVSSG